MILGLKLPNDLNDSLKGTWQSKVSLTCRWWKDRNTIMALIGAAIMALLFNFEAELGPIFVSAPRKEVQTLSIRASEPFL